MQHDQEQQLAILKALADPNRLGIVNMLSCGELCACRLLDRFNITQPTLSHHMKVLSDYGIVAARKEGVWMYYSLDRERIGQFLEFLRLLTSDKEDCACKPGQTCCGAQVRCCDGAEVHDEG
jgi:ArsR family transcriptional regulator